MLYMFSKTIKIAFYLLLAGCTFQLKDKHAYERTHSKLLEHGFKKELVQGIKIQSLVHSKSLDSKKEIVVYVEGDGDPNADDPTPNNLMLLQLILLDPRPNVYYVSRIGQYLAGPHDPKYWRTHRYCQEAVDEMQAVIGKIAGQKPVHLIGYSGGGAMAILVAANSTLNIRSITTIAGNLDTQTFTKYHGINPWKLSGSLNPIDYAKKVSNIPQLHLSGRKDRIVPPLIAKSFVKKSSNEKCIKHIVINDADHWNNWDKHWPNVLRMTNTCS